MYLSSNVLGADVTRELQQRRSAPLLQIGRDKFTRRDLAKVDCFNFNAAFNLSAILNNHLKVDDTRDVYYNVKPTQLALPRLGAVALSVLGAAFERKGLGGASPLENWVKHHQEDIVTFNTIKQREQREEAEERKRKRARRRARKEEAHEIRVARFEERQAT